MTTTCLVIFLSLLHKLHKLQQFYLQVKPSWVSWAKHMSVCICVYLCTYMYVYMYIAYVYMDEYMYVHKNV